MMGGFDYGLVMLGRLILYARYLLLLLGMAFGIMSLLALRRRPLDARRGRRGALIAVGLGVLVEVWIILDFKPSRCPPIAMLNSVSQDESGDLASSNSAKE